MAELLLSQPHAHEVFDAGATLMREGEPGDCAFVIESGEVEILHRQGDELVRIGVLGPGAVVGETCLIDAKLRSATARALGPCSVIKISRDAFARRLDEADPVLRVIMRVLMARYRNVLAQAQKENIIEGVFANTHFNDHAGHAEAISAIKQTLELREALVRQQLRLYYQPIIDVQNMRLAGFEALMRWQHPERGLVPPGQFIPVAEESGLIVDMSRWALSAACDDVKRLKAAVPREHAPQHPLFVSVNFSVKDFSEHDFFAHIQATLARQHTAPANIHLEITESLLMEEPQKAKAALERCRAHGVSVSIDDFGSGYSSLSYLHAFPIDTLKIDQSFIRSMRDSPASLMLVKSIIGLARNLKMKIIAEGIETREEARVVRDLGCQECQGYWFAKPMPLDEAVAFAQNWQPPSLWEA